MNPSGSGASGGEGGGGNGGQGGAGAATTTSSGDNTTLSIGGGLTGSTTMGGCPCDELHACVDDKCEPILQVDLTPSRVRIVNLGGGSVDETGTIAACERPLGVNDVTQVLAEEGDCRVEVSPWPEGDPPSFSAVTATAPSFGIALLEQADPAFCWVADVGVTPDFLTGEDVHFVTELGAGKGSFEIDAPSPPPLQIAAGVLKKGLPYEISWATTGAPPAIYVLLIDSDVQITCKPTSGNSIVIPASLTALLETTEPFLAVAAVTRGTPNVLEISPTYRANAAGGRTELHFLELDATP